MALGLMVPALALARAGVTRCSAPLPAGEFVRMQVVAHSDEPRDQAAKLEVVRVVRMHLAANQARDAAAALALVRAQLEPIGRRANQVLGASGLPYQTTLALGCLDFPAKSYGGLVFPPGAYPALRVTLGEGRGSNWWCVLFPPLCLVDLPSSLASPAGQDPAGLARWLEEAAGGGRRPGLRSWIWDWLKAGGWRPRAGTGGWTPPPPHPDGPARRP